MPRKSSIQSVPVTEAKLKGKWFNENLMSELCKYIHPLEEYVHYQCMPHHVVKYLDKLEHYENVINKYYPQFADDKVFVHLLSEITFVFHEKKREENEIKSNQLILNGTGELLSALKEANYYELNIESLIIKVRKSKINPSDVTDKKLPDLRKPEHIQPTQYKVTGTWPIRKIIKLVKENIDEFEEQARKEQWITSSPAKEKRRLKPEGFVKKSYAKSLYSYMREKLKDQMTSRQIKILGGKILYVFSIIKPKKGFRNRIDDLDDKFYVSNFEKYLS